MLNSSFYYSKWPFCCTAVRIYLYICTALYPLISGAIILSSDKFYISDLTLPIHIALLCFIAAEDIITMTIPDFFNALLFFNGITLHLITSGLLIAIKSALSSIIIFVFMYVFVLLTGNKIGGGDIKTISASAAYSGLKNTLYALSAAFFSAAFFCIFILLFSKEKRLRKE